MTYTMIVSMYEKIIYPYKLLVLNFLHIFSVNIYLLKCLYSKKIILKIECIYNTITIYI